MIRPIKIYDASKLTVAFGMKLENEAVERIDVITILWIDIMCTQFNTHYVYVADVVRLQHI